MGKADKKDGSSKLKAVGPLQPKRRKAPTRMLVKSISGEKNGQTRKVRICRMPRSYPTEDRRKRRRRNMKCFKDHTHKLRASITPGTVLILLAGRHKGKRVIFLKQLRSGLLLVTGPYNVNGCPLRRINQIYVIATKTKVDMNGVNLPERLTDEYFRRKKLKKPKQNEGEIFDTKKEEYTVSEERKEDQVVVDNQLLDVIRKSPEKKLLLAYLSAMFGLGSRQYPHKMMF
ncbi:hypothetical protein LSH36_15g12059 [Paralvinella palmiformis]|uniref:Large ribosomal subunit protein eL6 n=1 Tax=Paralvinella palmiformis TaxID=53620 RepID=A0AAD9NHP3_9ANNE|nr:hypothetical protein LSH36_15g12059 [Paralvinella palmiformis]